MMVTCAMPDGLRSREPLKMKSCMRAPRRIFADCSPSTQLIASLTLDFPQPVGADNRGDPIAVEPQFLTVGERLIAEQLEFFEMEQEESTLLCCRCYYVASRDA